MKFGHEFTEVLEKEGFPPNWVNTAIPYRKLKKLLKKIQGELTSLGLDSATLAQLHQSSPDEDVPIRDGVVFQYEFAGDENFVPKLTFFINIEDGTPEDAQLSPATRRYFEAQASKHNEHAELIPFGQDDQADSTPSGEDATRQLPESCTARTIVSEQSRNIRRIDVRLRFDTEFFGLLQGDITSLDNLQAQEQRNFTDEVQVLSTSIAEVARPKPSGFHKTDLNRWRELFDLYLQAAIFFSTNEFDHGRRTSSMAAEKLQWFQSQVVKRDIVASFKLKASHETFQHFVKLNIGILQQLKFQEINSRAIGKILKKFDKRTALGARRTFPKLLLADSIMSESLAKAVCAQISQKLVHIVPQLEDHTCPICCDICWRPIRLNCNHLICIRCAIILQRQHKGNCPLCRENVILQADTDNIDRELEKYLRKFFPKEIIQKQIANETADGIEKLGPFYVHPSESVCAVM